MVVYLNFRRGSWGGGHHHQHVVESLFSQYILVAFIDYRYHNLILKTVWWQAIENQIR